MKGDRQINPKRENFLKRAWSFAFEIGRRKARQDTRQGSELRDTNMKVRRSRTPIDPAKVRRHVHIMKRQRRSYQRLARLQRKAA